MLARHHSSRTAAIGDEAIRASGKKTRDRALDCMKGDMMYFLSSIAQTGPPADRQGLIASTPLEAYFLLALLPLQALLFEHIAWQRLLMMRGGIAKQWVLLAGFLLTLVMSVVLIGRLVSKSLYCF